MSESSTAKVALLSYCRYYKQMPYLATEVGTVAGCLADVLTSDGKFLFEFEVKTSLKDFLSDSKKPKHLIYDPMPIIWDNPDVGTKQNITFNIINKHDYFVAMVGGTPVRTFKTSSDAKEYLDNKYIANSATPNMLYYVIPEWMWDKHNEKLINTIHTNYGIMTFIDSNYKNIQVKKKANKIHNLSVSHKSLLVLSKRMSSELAALSLTYYHQNCNWFSLGKKMESTLKIDDGISNFIGENNLF